MNTMAERFEDGEMLLPQIMLVADEAFEGDKVGEPELIRGSGRAKLCAIVINTIEGDIHDLGKNMIAAMLKGFGL